MDPLTRYGTATCKYFSAQECRSCSLLDLPGEARIRSKEESLSSLLSAFNVVPLRSESLRIPADPWGSRCKVKASVTGTTETPIVGIVRSDLTSVDLTHCPLTPPHIVGLITTVKELLKEIGLSPYDVVKRTGELKNLIVLSNQDASEGILRFVLRSREGVPRIRKQVPRIQSRHPWLKVVSCNIQPIPAAILEGPDEEILTPTITINVRYNHIDLSFHPQAFMQVTHEIAEALYLRAANYVSGRSFAHALDLYCGVGGFSLSLGPSVQKITGVEVSPMAIESAKRSALRLGNDRAEFYADDVEQFLSTALSFRPDLVIVNPPRRGLSETIRATILEIAPEVILYSSCSPETFARDIAHLSRDYTLKELAPFDMFPMTAHIEVLGFLERTK
jgi:23S rRNA (uracil747-C5)-methyltransferase